MYMTIHAITRRNPTAEQTPIMTPYSDPLGGDCMERSDSGASGSVGNEKYMTMTYDMENFSKFITIKRSYQSFVNSKYHCVKYIIRLQS